MIPQGLLQCGMKFLSSVRISCLTPGAVSTYQVLDFSIPEKITVTTKGFNSIDATVVNQEYFKTCEDFGGLPSFFSSNRYHAVYGWEAIYTLLIQIQKL